MKRALLVAICGLTLIPLLPAAAGAGGLNVIDKGGTRQRWPGGLYEFADGHWAVVYERKGQPYIREAPALLGNFGPEVNILDRAYNSAGYDPGIVALDDGTVIVTYCTGTKVRGRVRLGPGRFGHSVVLASAKKGTIKEQTVARIGGKTFLTFNYKPDSRSSNIWDLRIARIYNGMRMGPQITVATKATGTGIEGEQRRAVTSGTGVGGRLITVWSQNAGGGPRDVFASISTNNGAAWGAKFRIATYPDKAEPGGKHDLVNPFAILVGGVVIVYFTQDGVKHGLGFATSTNHGSSFGPRKDVTAYPSNVNWARTVVGLDSGKLVAYVNANSMTTLGDFAI